MVHTVFHFIQLDLCRCSPNTKLTLITNWPSALCSHQVISLTAADNSLPLILNHDQRRDYDHAQTLNSKKRLCSVKLVLVYCNYLKNYCPQEGSVITFNLLFISRQSRPDPVGLLLEGRMNRLKSEEEGRKEAVKEGNRGLSMLSQLSQLPHEVDPPSPSVHENTLIHSWWFKSFFRSKKKKKKSLPPEFLPLEEGWL